MAPNFIEKISALTRIPTNADSASNGTGSGALREKEKPEHHEDASTPDNAYPESPYPSTYVDYHYTRYPNRWSRIRYVCFRPGPYRNS